jgi:NAD(P)-dependent dehydrogenase (short-subunit alcohol dehydrogenase family)
MPLPAPSPLEQGATLADRVIFITGATGGLGAPLARACAQGATVVPSRIEQARRAV